MATPKRLATATVMEARRKKEPTKEEGAVEKQEEFEKKPEVVMRKRTAARMLRSIDQLKEVDNIHESMRKLIEEEGSQDVNFQFSKDKSMMEVTFPCQNNENKRKYLRDMKTALHARCECQNFFCSCVDVDTCTCIPYEIGYVNGYENESSD